MVDGLIIQPCFQEMYNILGNIRDQGHRGPGFIPGFMPFDFSPFPKPLSPSEWLGSLQQITPSDKSICHEFIDHDADFYVFRRLEEFPGDGTKIRKQIDMLLAGKIIKSWHSFSGFSLGGLDPSVQLFDRTLLLIADTPLPLVNKWYAITHLTNHLGLPEPYNSRVEEALRVSTGNIQHAKQIIKGGWRDYRKNRNI